MQTKQKYMYYFTYMNLIHFLSLEEKINVVQTFGQKCIYIYIYIY